LDAGTRGLVVVAATGMEDRVDALIHGGKDVVKKQVAAGRGWAEEGHRIALTDAGSRIFSVG
jgi:hypothetical protein